MSRVTLRVLVAFVTTRFVLFGGTDDWSDEAQTGRLALRTRLASARAFTNAIKAHASATTMAPFAGAL